MNLVNCWSELSKIMNLFINYLPSSSKTTTEHVKFKPMTKIIITLVQYRYIDFLARTINSEDMNYDCDESELSVDTRKHEFQKQRVKMTVAPDTQYFRQPSHIQIL